MEDAKDQPSTSAGTTSKDEIRSRIKTKTSNISAKIAEKKSQLKVKDQSPQSESAATRPKPRRNSSKSNSISSNVTNESLEKKRKRVRNRGNRGGGNDAAKQKPDEVPSNSPINLDGESELIITLLSLKPAKREDFLLRKAEAKGLIFFNKATKSYKLNEHLLTVEVAGGSPSDASKESKRKAKSLEFTNPKI